jgi:hypothetical protein
MLSISIPLPEVDDEAIMESAPAAQSDPDLDPTNSVYLETLLQAMESANGLAITCGTRKNAVALRHRLYKVRKKAIAAGNTTLHTITISIIAAVGTHELHLKKMPFEVRQL